MWRSWSLSKRYNLILILIYIVLLSYVYWMADVPTLRREIMMIFLVLTLLLTILRLNGVQKEVRFLDLLLTCSFALILLGSKMGVSDPYGFITVVLIAFVVISLGDGISILSGLIILTPPLIQIGEKWKLHSGYHFESILSLYFGAMVITSMSDGNDTVELVFLNASFLLKTAILTFCLT